jgi:hypothetical protein
MIDGLDLEHLFWASAAASFILGTLWLRRRHRARASS